MPVAYTSRVALASIVDQLSGKRRQVYECIKNWNVIMYGEGPSIEDIAKQTGMKEHSVSGRVNELKKAGAIQPAPMKINQSEKPAMTYTALQYQEPKPNTNPQLELF